MAGNVIKPADAVVEPLAVDLGRRLRWVSVIEPAGAVVVRLALDLEQWALLENGVESHRWLCWITQVVSVVSSDYSAH